MHQIDLAIAYTWEYDEEFVNAIIKIFNEKNLSTLIITYDNVDEIIQKVSQKELICKKIKLT